MKAVDLVASSQSLKCMGTKRKMEHISCLLLDEDGGEQFVLGERSVCNLDSS